MSWETFAQVILIMAFGTLCAISIIGALKTLRWKESDRS